jgi:carbamoyl-phosphate synthase large subunit
VIRSLAARDDLEVFAADMDGWASGLYLVPAERRRIVPPGLDDGLVEAVRRLVASDRIDVIVATVDAELRPLASQRAELGAALAAPSLATLETCLDKWMLAQACEAHVRVPTTRLLTAEAIAADWDFPLIVKPRSGAGSRGVRLVPDRAALDAIAPDEMLIAQEYLPGEEFSVDVLAAADGHVIAAVPRSRARVDSGVAVAGFTLRSPELEAAATAVARAIGLVGVANVQLKYDSAGVPALLEVNPRFPGAMPLTIAAGVDMPSLAVDLALGRELPDRLEFRELANVRYLEDIFLDRAEVLRSDLAMLGADGP